MKKKYQIMGFCLLVLCSLIYDFQLPEELPQQQVVSSYVILEGAFITQGKYEYTGEKTVRDVINDVGVQDDANLEALKLDRMIQDESVIYLPQKNNQSISLNYASKEELMELDRIGEKTAQKIIDYRNQQPFTCLEDIMNISGIGEKTYERLRDQLCL